jgi:Beta-propeller repeat
MASTWVASPEWRRVQMTTAKGSGTRAACRALVTTIGLALGAPVCGAEDAASREPIEPGLVGDAAGVATDDGGQRLWARQPGTKGFDAARSVATDADGNVYVAGQTEGALGGREKGDGDAFVIKYDGDGHRLWARQPGTRLGDTANGVATDMDGNVYIAGGTEFVLRGDSDAFVAKYDRDGHRLWTQQPASGRPDNALGVATDAEGNVYVVGATLGALGGPKNGDQHDADAFVIKYDRDGHQLWALQPGTSSPDSALGVASDMDGNVYVVGGTSGALGGPKKGGKNDQDAFVIKYAGGGHRLWALQVGTSGYDVAYGIATDVDGNVYVVGNAGALTGPNKEGAFVIKYNGDGHQLWARQPATNEGSIAWGVSADANGNVYIAGSTIEGLGGPYKGSEDAFVIKYDFEGDVLWLRQFGRNVNVGGDFPQGVATDVDGNVYVAGLTWGRLAGADKGSGDAFVIKFAGGGSAVQAVPGS